MRLLTPENGDVSSLTDTGTKIQISPNVPNLNMKGNISVFDDEYSTELSRWRQSLTLTITNRTVTSCQHPPKPVDAF